MVCEQTIKEFEARLKRKLTPAEKKKIEEKLHHVEHQHPEKEILVLA